MAYVVSEKFKMAIDGIGSDIRTFDVGELNETGIPESAIEWALKNGLIDIVGDDEDSEAEEEQHEPESVGESEAVETVVDCAESETDEATEEDLEEKDVIETANAMTDKDELDEYAETNGIKLDKRKSLDNMKTQFSEEYENKMLSGSVENKMIDKSE